MARSEEARLDPNRAQSVGNSSLPEPPLVVRTPARPPSADPSKHTFTRFDALNTARHGPNRILLLIETQAQANSPPSRVVSPPSSSFFLEWQSFHDKRRNCFATLSQCHARRLFILCFNKKTCVCSHPEKVLRCPTLTRDMRTTTTISTATTTSTSTTTTSEQPLRLSLAATWGPPAW